MKQRGNELVIVGIVVLVVVAIAAGAVLYVQHVRDSAKAAGKEEGRREALLEVAQRDNKQMVAAQFRIAQLEAERDQKEGEHQARVAQIDKEGRDALKAEQAKHGRFLDDLLAGRVRLPGQGRADASRLGGGGEQSAETVAGAGVGDGAEGARLPAELGRFLGARFRLADEIVGQLTACQKLLIEDRRTCNE
jgi:membrane protein involved in colicin uptake